MVQHAVSGASLGVVADEEGGVEALVNSLHHRERLGRAGDELGAGIEILDEDVAHRTVGVVDQNLTGPAGQSPFDGGVDLARHQLLSSLVLFPVHLGLLASHYT